MTWLLGHAAAIAAGFAPGLAIGIFIGWFSHSRPGVPPLD